MIHTFMLYIQLEPTSLAIRYHQTHTPFSYVSHNHHFTLRKIKKQPKKESLEARLVALRIGILIKNFIINLKTHFEWF